MSIDNQYVRRFRQHIPFYKDEDLLTSTDGRRMWHHLRVNCDNNCIWGIPVIQGQYLMFVIEDDVPVDEAIKLTGGGANSIIQLCCMADGLFSTDPEDCTTITPVTIQQQTFQTHRICVIDGEPIQFNFLRIKLPDDAPCGMYYIRILAYNTQPFERNRVYYSQPVEVFTQQQAIDWRMIRLNINDSCEIGGINYAWGIQSQNLWDSIGGYDVYLPREVRSSFVEKIENEEVEEDGVGNEVPVFKSVDWRYQFDTGYVPDYYAEFINELSLARDNAIIMLDDTALSSFPSLPQVASHFVEVSRVETEMDPDGDGCFIQTNVQFLINKYNKSSCCDMSDCECPQDEAINVKSYTTSQEDAELVASFGDVYLVPDGAAGPTNPDWAAQNNKLATWTSGGWNYTVPAVRAVYYAEDSLTYYIQVSNGVASLSDNLMVIVNETYNPGTCIWDIQAAIPQGVFAKIQYKIGVGAWTDFTGTYYNSDEWWAEVQISTPTSATWNLRLVALDTGCNIPTGEEGSVQQLEDCI